MVDPRPIDFEIVRLVASNRWAALATLEDGSPAVSMVAYAPEPDLGGLLVFLSGLAAHTANLLTVPRASIGITSPDLGSGDPQELPRVSLDVDAFPMERDSAEFAASWPTYAERFPAAARTLMLPDFRLFRLEVRGGRYVGGFARAVGVHVEYLAAAAIAMGGD